MIEPINVAKKNNRQKVTGSLNTRIPNSAVPTPPIPVQTAYAVPIGKLCVAFTKRSMLMINAAKKPPYHQNTPLPADSLAFPKQNAKATSNKPAIINTIQLISSFHQRSVEG